ncbi:MerR family DNA-binding protein [Brachybacterium huguangmaarense]
MTRVAQRVGLTVKEIAERFAELPPEPQPEDWRRFSDQLIAEAESRVAALREEMTELRGESKLCEIASESTSRNRLGARARTSRGATDA